MTKRSPFVERSWRCCALGCSDYLNLKRQDLSDPPDPEDGCMYLLFDWGGPPLPWWQRIKRAWRWLRDGKDDWYEFSIEEPYVARDIAAELLAGAVALERGQGTNVTAAGPTIVWGTNSIGGTK